MEGTKIPISGLQGEELREVASNFLRCLRLVDQGSRSWKLRDLRKAKD